MQLAREARDAFWAANPQLHGVRPRPWWRRRWGRLAPCADGSEYVGHYGVDDATLRDFHRPRLAALLAAGPDVLACETLPCKEARVLAELLRARVSAGAGLGQLQLPRWRAHLPGRTLGRGGGGAGRLPASGGGGVNCTAPGFIPELVAAARRQRQTGAGVSQRGRNLRPGAQMLARLRRPAGFCRSGPPLACPRRAADWRLLPHHAGGYSRAGGLGAAAANPRTGSQRRVAQSSLVPAWRSLMSGFLLLKHKSASCRAKCNDRAESTLG